METQPDQAQKVGYLHRKIGRKWHKAFAILKENQLNFFKSPIDTVPLAEIALSHYQGTTHVENKSFPAIEVYPNATSSQPAFVLGFETLEDKDEWVFVLEHKLRGGKGFATKPNAEEMSTQTAAVKIQSHFRGAMLRRKQKNRLVLEGVDPDWQTYVDEHRHTADYLKKTPRLAELILLHGIPGQLRAELWTSCSGAKNIMVGGFYDGLLKIGGDKKKSAKVKDYVTLEAGVRRIMEVYQRRNSGLGFCEVLAPVVSLFLATMPEESAFWMLVAIVEEMLPQYYVKDRMRALVDQHVLMELVSIHLPELDAHMNSSRFYLPYITLDWFQGLFVNVVTRDLACRIMDLFLYDGVEVLFRIGLGILKIREPLLMEKTKAQDMYQSLRSHPYAVDSSRLRKIAFQEFPGLGDDIIRLQKKYKKRIVNDIRQIPKRRETFEVSKHDLLTRQEFEGLIQLCRDNVASTVLTADQMQSSILARVPKWRESDSMSMLVDRVIGSDPAYGLPLQPVICGLSTLLQGNLDEKLYICYNAYNLGMTKTVSERDFKTMFLWIAKWIFDVDISFRMDAMVEDMFENFVGSVTSKLSFSHFKIAFLNEPILVEAMERGVRLWPKVNVPVDYPPWDEELEEEVEEYDTVMSHQEGPHGHSQPNAGARDANPTDPLLQQQKQQRGACPCPCSVL